MNSNSLYITTNRIILKSDPNDPSTWQDLYRLAPELRNSLCCVVCGNLLTDPQSPTIGKCQHHLCRQCKDGTKKINPVCVWCNDCKEYNENKTLQILLQCYKKMCVMLLNSGIFHRLVAQASQSNIASDRAGNLIKLIKEGAAFQDDYQINAGLSKSVYSSLPRIYRNASTQTLPLSQIDRSRNILLNSNLSNVTSDNTLYLVMHAGSDNKFTIEQKPKESTTDNETFISSPATTDCRKKSIFKNRHNISIIKKHPTNKTRSILLNTNVRNVTSGNTLHSVMYAGSDTKIAMEQKPREATTNNEKFISLPATTDCLKKSTFKKRHNIRILKKYPTDKTRSMLLNSNVPTVTSGNTLHSVMYAGTDNKITKEQKPKESTTDNENFIISPATTNCLKKPVFKKPYNISILKKHLTDKSSSILLNSDLRNVTSGNTLHSVMYAGSDNKITIEQKPKDTTTDIKILIRAPAKTLNKSILKKRILKPCQPCRGCCCGKAAFTPGKLSCCGWRCPCYAECKPCIECKRRHCKNPHRPEGNKVGPHTPHIEILHPTTLAVSGQEQQQLRKQTLLENDKVEPVPTLTMEQLDEFPMVGNTEIFDPSTIAVSGQEEQQLEKQSLLESDKVKLVPAHTMEQLDEFQIGGNTEIFDPTMLAVSGQEQQQLQKQSLLENDTVALVPNFTMEELDEFQIGGNTEIFDPTMLAVSGQEQQQLQKQSLLENYKVERVPNFTMEELDEFLMGGNTEIFDPSTIAVSGQEEQQLEKQSLLESDKVKLVPAHTMEQLDEFQIGGNTEIFDPTMLAVSGQEQQQLQKQSLLENDTVALVPNFTMEELDEFQIGGNTEIFDPTMLAVSGQEQQQLQKQSLLENDKVERVPNFTIEELDEFLMGGNTEIFDPSTIAVSGQEEQQLEKQSLLESDKVKLVPAHTMEQLDEFQIGGNTEIFDPTMLAVSGQEQQQLQKQSLLENDTVALVPNFTMEELDEFLMGGNTEIFDPTMLAVSGQEQQQLQKQSLLENDKVERVPNFTMEELDEFLMGGNTEIFDPTILAVSGQEQQQSQKQSLLENDKVERVPNFTMEELDKFLMVGNTESFDLTTLAVSGQEQQQFQKHSLLENVKVERVPTLTMEQLNERQMVGNIEVPDSYTDADIIASRYISTRW